MAYFNYHAKAKGLIRSDSCIGYKVLDNYNGIKPALVLFFDSHRPMPIRQKMWQDYFLLLKEYKVGEINAR